MKSILLPVDAPKAECVANSVDPSQMLRSVVSDLGQLCLL